MSNLLETLHLFWQWLVAVPHYKAYLGIAYAIYFFGLSFWIILQKREPAATLSWLLSLAALPYIGFIVYYWLGPQKIKRQRLRRIHAHNQAAPDDIPEVPQCDSSKLSRMARATTAYPSATATSAHWLVDGAATYQAIEEAIASAEHHIHLEYYIFCPDETGTRILNALVAKAKAGVQVRILLDGVGSAKTPNSFLQPLRDAGGETAWFHAAKWPSPFKRPWLNLRTHRKIVIVDGRIGFTGGINITDEENESLRNDAYRDLHIRLEGRVVTHIQVVFIEDWLYATQQSISNFDIRKLYPKELPHPRDLSYYPAGDINVQVLVSGPDSIWETIHRAHVSAIEQATQRVWLVTPYFVPGEAARMALTSAALSGLDTRLIVPKMSDSRFVTLAARSYFAELLKAGVKVYEYGPRMLHTKALLVDNDTCIVGSANFDQRSFRLNFEISMLFNDVGLTSQLAKHIENELSQADQVDPERPRSLLRQRLPEAVARLLSPLL